MTRAIFWGPLLAALFGVVWFGYSMRAASDRAGEMQIKKFGKFPVQDGGRVKPIDTFARVQLMNVTRRQEYYWEILGKEKDDQGRPKVKEAKRRPAIEWFLNLQAEGYASAMPRMPFVIEDKKLRDWFGLAHDRPGHQFNLRDLGENPQILEKLKELDAKRANPKGAKPDELKAMALLKELQDREKEGEAMLEKRQQTNHTSFAVKIFRIDNDQVKEMLGLEPREGHRYSLAEILTGDSKPDDPNPNNRGKRFRTFMEKASKINQQLAAQERTEKDLDLVETKVLELDRHLRMQTRLRQMDGLLIVPPGGTVTEWKSLGEALAEGDAQVNPNAAAMEKMIRAYAVDDVKTFNKEVDAYAAAMATQFPNQTFRARIEAWFHQFAPFYQCSLLYLGVLILAIASWIVPSQGGRAALRWSAFSLACTILVIHTQALGLRIYLTERPPITNLYSASVSIGWMCVLLCLFLELIFRNSMAVTAASVLGFATMVVAHHLGTSGDTMEVMQAVLDTNFWLATHVTTVSAGYAATFVAGLFGAGFVYLMLASVVRQAFAQRRPLNGLESLHFVVAVFGLVMLPTCLIIAVLGGFWVLVSDGESLDLVTLFIVSLPIFAAGCVYAGIVIARRFSPEFLADRSNEIPRVVHVVDALALTNSLGKALGTALYGVVCFATLLSFVGTVLGGIWADQSWGRFWGWDPKENGALMIVIMNAMILHARWGGIIKERGMSLLAIIAGMITVWSYFGTNQLGVGLHAYGFNNTLALGCAIFWMSQMGVMAFGLLPLSCWRAYADLHPLPAPAATAAAPRARGGRGSTGIQPA